MRKHVLFATVLSLALGGCLFSGSARTSTAPPPPATTVVEEPAPPPSGPPPAAPPPAAEPARAQPATVVVVPAAAPAEPRNHGQERKAEVHERNEERKEAHEA